MLVPADQVEYRTLWHGTSISARAFFFDGHGSPSGDERRDRRNKYGVRITRWGLRQDAASQQDPARHDCRAWATPPSLGAGSRLELTGLVTHSHLLRVPGASALALPLEAPVKTHGRQLALPTGCAETGS